MPTAPTSLTLKAIAEHIGAQLKGSEQTLVSGLATLAQAAATDLSFLSNRHYINDLKNTRAAAVILTEADSKRCAVPCLITANPYLGYARAARLLYPDSGLAETGIHPSAWVHPQARIAADAYVGAQAVIERDCVIEAGVLIGPGCILGAGVRIGTGSRLVARVTLCAQVILGERVIIHPGAVIGADGFGLAHDGQDWVKIPQLGGVRIGNDVEIGANTTIDRGALEDTIIEDDVKLDNQIQIGHNSLVGAHTAIAGCCGIAGSTRIGRRCLIGGGVGIAGHLEIADDVQIAAGSGVRQSITEAGVYASGTPLQPLKQWHRNHARFKHLDDMAQQLKRLNEFFNDKAP
jgi:UDP-3-O-[3-hydroxymyristoyl] glucosamine N-acyltransferase